MGLWPLVFFCSPRGLVFGPTLCFLPIGHKPYFMLLALWFAKHNKWSFGPTVGAQACSKGARPLATCCASGPLDQPLFYALQTFLYASLCFFMLCKWSYLPLLAPTCPYLPLLAPTCPYLPLLAPTCPYLPLLAPTCPYGARGTGHGARGTGHGARGTGHGARGTTNYGA